MCLCLRPVRWCNLFFFFQLNAQKKEIVDTDALIERYRKEIEDLKRRLEEREQEANREAPSVRSRRLSAREVRIIVLSSWVMLTTRFPAN
jgi:predicted  nucleic acid-binding Zn-ribbon protein